MRPERKPDKSDLEEKKGQEGTSEPTDTRPGVGKEPLQGGSGRAPAVTHPRTPSREWSSQALFYTQRKEQDVFTTGPFEQGPQEDHQL